MRAAGIESAAGKQKIVLELYEKFFKNAFPHMAERLGIVYTPVEIVDFILKSADELLRSELGCSLSSEGVHVIDPFCGTGISGGELGFKSAATRRVMSDSSQNTCFVEAHRRLLPRSPDGVRLSTSPHVAVDGGGHDICERRASKSA